MDGPVEQKVLNYWGKLVDEKAVATENDFEADWGHHIASDMYAVLHRRGLGTDLRGGRVPDLAPTRRPTP